MKKLCLGWKTDTIREQNLTLFSWPKRVICVRIWDVVDVKSFFPPPFSLSPLSQKTWSTFPFAFSFYPEDWVLWNDNSFSIIKLLHFRISPCTSHRLCGTKRSIFKGSKCNKHVISFSFLLRGWEKETCNSASHSLYRTFQKGFLST